MLNQPKLITAQTSKPITKPKAAETKDQSVINEAQHPEQAFETLDRMAHASVAKATSGLS